MQSLKIASLMSDNHAPFCARLAHYLGEQLGIATTFVHDSPWQVREQRFDAGEFNLVWLCGLLYTRKQAAQQRPFATVIAAPVMQAARYQQRPSYFSDVIVRADSRFQQFADLRGATWAFNDMGSHSGYLITQYHLAQLGERGGFFGRTIEAGSHLQAIQSVLAGESDGAAIDSTVLDLARAQDHTLAQQLRVITSLGPSPIPPWVACGVSADVRTALQTALVSIADTKIGRALLAEAQIQRMVAVDDATYDPLRKMAQTAQTIPLISGNLQT